MALTLHISVPDEAALSSWVSDGTSMTPCMRFGAYSENQKPFPQLTNLALASTSDIFIQAMLLINN
jgi:hypothetical protein